MNSADSFSRMAEKLQGPILITGAGGFVGANLLRQLLEVRNDVFGTITSGSNWRLDGIRRQHLPRIDLLDASSVRNVCDQVRPKIIFHCAAFGAYPFQNDSARIYQTNFVGLSNFLDAVSSLDLNSFVHAGTSSEYGLNCAGPDENAHREPNSRYAVSKSAAADLLHYFGRVRGLPCVNLRLYSVYGPYEDGSRLVPALAENGLKGQLPPFVAPDTARDFVHVDDVVRAFVAAAIHMAPKLHGQSFNIATGRRLTVREIAQIAKQTFNIDSEPEFDTMAPRAWDIVDWYGNPAKAEEAFSWTAEIGFEEGLKRTADWWRTQLQSGSLADFSEQDSFPKAKTSLTAIIACYKDAEAIPVMHRRLTDTLTQLELDYEIIFVDDCSPDETVDILKRISKEDPRVTGITHSRNFGSQAAFRSGMEFSAREACVLLDGDLQDPPELIEAFVEQWRDGNDVVFGRRTKREMGLITGFLYKLFYRIFASMSDIEIPRDAGDFSLIDQRVVGWMLACGERDSFLRGLRAYVGFRQTGVDYVRPERVYGRSTNSFFKNIRWAKKAIFSFSKLPLELFTLAGFILLATTIILSLGVIAVKLIAPDRAPQGITILLLAVMFFGSINLFGIAIIGEYIGKIIDEVKRRPPFIRRAIIIDGRLETPPDE